ncbi:MAG: hypothetical protein K0S63_328 [Gammaproteobacteria bacterium]|jgi:hypothetical protein|nr:hypothetical protein [Gammaproteobacteria bacterium]
MKKIYKMALMFSVIFFIYVCYVNFLSTPDLTEKQAVMMVFNNYNDINKTAIWKNIPIPKENNNSFFSKKVGIVSAAFFQPYKENGKKKFFLLTKTIPIDIPFECHACRPLLSGTVFSKEKNAWTIESQQLFLGYDGEYGIVPAAKLIQVGDDRFGLVLEFKYVSDEMTDVENEFLIPYKKDIINAYQETIYSDNFNRCGRYIQCTTYSAKIEFEKSNKEEFYRLKVSKFGTDNDPSQDDRAVPVDIEAIYQFRKGKYIQVT